MAPDLEPREYAATPRFPWFRRKAVITPLFVLLAVWLWVVVEASQVDGGPAGVGLASDFAIFYSASRLLGAHGNPYDPGQLYHAYTVVLRSDHVAVSTNFGWVRAGNPPLFYWALEPLTKLPFRTVAWLWLLAMLLVSALGGLAALAAAGWTRRLVPLLVFLAMPQVIGGYFTGNLSPIVFLGLALGLAYARKHPLVSGMFLSLTWLKPSVALPLVLLIVLFHAADWKRVATGFVAATAALVLLALGVLGPLSFVRWAHGLSTFSQSIASQPEIAPLSGLYARWAPGGLRTGLELLSLIVAAALTGWWWWTHRGRRVTMLDTGWLWFAWFLATPYAHINDVILLTPPVLAIVGVNARWASRPLAAAVLYLLFIGVVALPIHIPITLEPLELLAAAVCLVIGSRQAEHRDEKAAPEGPFASALSSSGTACGIHEMTRKSQL